MKNETWQRNISHLINRNPYLRRQERLQQEIHIRLQLQRPRQDANSTLPPSATCQITAIRYARNVVTSNTLRRR